MTQSPTSSLSSQTFSAKRSRSSETFASFVGLCALAAGCLWTPTANAQNLLSNGTFDTAQDPWWGHAAEGFEQTIEIVEGRLCSTMLEGAGGENPWDIIVGYSGVPLVAGQFYHIAFTAVSDVPRSIRYKTGLGDAPYTDYYLGKIDVQPTPQVFEVTYYNLREDANAQFQFQFGGGPGVVCYDDIVVEPVPPPTPPAYLTPAASGLPLKNYAGMVKIGTAVDTPIFLSNPMHNAIVANEFNMITPANSMKMNIIQPTEGVFDFTDTDALLTWAEQSGMEFHGHPLVWHTQAPTWLEDTEFDRDQMIAYLYAHIDALMTRYPGRMPYWDVVNEAVDENAGPGMRSTIWFNRIGADFMDLAFARAAAHEPNAKLLYNDYNISIMGNPKADFVFNMVSDMRARGVPVTTIGMQNHWYIREDGTDNTNVPAFRDNMARYAAIGVDVQITECDVRIHAPVTPEKLQRQAQIYADILQACIDAPNCQHMTFWGLSDLDSWVPETFDNEGAAHLWDVALAPKAAYFSVSDVFATNAAAGQSQGGCSYHANLPAKAPWHWAFVGLLGFGLWSRRRARPQTAHSS